MKSGVRMCRVLSPGERIAGEGGDKQLPRVRRLDGVHSPGLSSPTGSV